MSGGRRGLQGGGVEDLLGKTKFERRLVRLVLVP
jgi:hypothetical protein